MELIWYIARFIYSTSSFLFNWIFHAFRNCVACFFYKQHLFSTQPQCCLAFSWIEHHMLLRCCLIHKSIIILRHFLYLLSLSSYLDLGLFMSYLCDLFFVFIFIFIMINHIILWIQTFMFFRVCPYIFG